jgi:hypothetical protein
MNERLACFNWGFEPRTFEPRKSLTEYLIDRNIYNLALAK